MQGSLDLPTPTKLPVEISCLLFILFFDQDSTEREPIVAMLRTFARCAIGITNAGIVEIKMQSSWQCVPPDENEVASIS